jgi:EmrB/QacA subfamily drug resistance transporter
MASSIAQSAPQQRIDYSTTLDHGTKLLILAAALICLFLSSLDQTIVSTALPRIVSELQGLDLLAWTSTAYLLASTAMIPIYGKLSDIYGRKPILLFGIIVFLIGSVLCGLASSMLQLVIFRGVQGFGAAALTSTAFAIPADIFAPAERARYQGIFGAAFGLSSVIGPFLGGLLTDNLSWHWVFFVNLPVGLVAIAFIVAKMPRLDSGIRSPIDYLGSLTLLLTVVPLLLGLTLDKTIYAWGSPLVLGLLATSLVGLVLFVIVERRAASPIIPFVLFRNPTYRLAVFISAAVGATLFSAIFFLSLYMVNVLGTSATEAGTTLIPLTLSLVFGSVISANIVQRLGRYKAAIVGGLVIMVVATWWLTTLQIDTNVWMVRLRMVVLGLGLGPALPLLNLAVQNAVPFEYLGSATASRQFFLQLGQVIGSAIFGVILTATLTSAITTNLAPVQAKLPAEIAAQLDANILRNGVSGAPEAGGESLSVGDRIAPAVGPELAAEIDLGLKRAFTLSITQIYLYALPLVVVALIMGLLLPEIPLRKTNRTSPVVALE